MPKYIIPVTYTMYGKYEIEADTLIDAIDEVHSTAMPLPPDAEYLTESMTVGEEDVAQNNELSEDELIELSEYLAELYR